MFNKHVKFKLWNQLSISWNGQIILKQQIQTNIRTIDKLK